MGDYLSIKKVLKEIPQEISSIEQLNDDCFHEILKHLPMIDKIRVERVSKRWQTMARSSWNNLKCMKLSSHGIKTCRREYVFLPTEEAFVQIFGLCGRYICEIDLSVVQYGNLHHLLPNIRRLKLTDCCAFPYNACLTVSYPDWYPSKNIYETRTHCSYYAWVKGFSWLLTCGQNIESFELTMNHSYYIDENFASLIRTLKKLTSFSLYHCDYLNSSGFFLLLLPFETLQSLILSSRCRMPFDNYLLPVIIERCKKLVTFCLSGLTKNRLLTIFKAIKSQCEFLKNLKFRIYDDVQLRNPSVLLSTMSMLVHLEKLDITRSNCISDAFLNVVANNCKKLTFLELRGCRHVTDVGISSICNLEKLTYLGISALPNIRNPSLNKLKTLVILEVQESEQIKEDCLCSFIANAHQLRALDIGNCAFITNKFFNIAVEMTQTRKSKIELDLYVKGPTIMNDADVNKLPFFNIITNFIIFPAKYGIQGHITNVREM